jgi:hypothetical protein
MRGEAPSAEELAATHCLEPGDRVPGRPAMTEFRQRARLHQARWRAAHGHPLGSQPIAPRPGERARPVGSRLPLEYARTTGANFVTPAAVDAARDRAAVKEPRQVFTTQRLWADLLWAESLAINLFGDLAADLPLADRAVHRWWPDTPGHVRDVRFAHSPGRLDLDFIGSLVTFDAAFELDLGDGERGMVALITKYHDALKREIPKPSRRARYLDVMARSGVFGRDALGAVDGTELTVMWLTHLLALSMLQHPSGEWRWVRFVVVHAAGNTDYAGSSARYRTLLSDDATFASITIEDLLARGPLPRSSTAALRARYGVA